MGIALYLKYCILKNIVHLFCAGSRAIKDVAKSCLAFCFNDNIQIIENAVKLDLRDKKKTKPRRLSRRSLKLLKKLFKYNHYPTKAEKVSLALASHIKIEQVNSWLYNQRKKKNFKNKELEEKHKIKIKNTKILKQVFEIDPMLEVHSELQKLKQKTKLSETKIKKWFQNRRYRANKGQKF